MREFLRDKNYEPMSESIITVENLSKRYMIGLQSQKGDGLRHALEQTVRAPFQRLCGGPRVKRAKDEEFWALRDLNLEIKEGEVVGLIGSNGAGKSTLLKILSRITEPTQGRIHLRGRVSSLLEVGTGFHPELTGRENIFLNGAILGMERAEIKRKFDEIVDFSGLEKFLDTPVKRYSSGMYVRLAFAVAAHLEPEILIVDEVLAVGDSEFQKKCISKMNDVSKREGRTVIIVSHQIVSIQNLCTRCVLLEKGSIVMDDSTEAVVRKYTASKIDRSKINLADRTDRTGKGLVRTTALELMNSDGNNIARAMSGNEIIIRVKYSAEKHIILKRCIIIIDIGCENNWYFGLSTALSSTEELKIMGDGWVDIHVPAWPLLGGNYQLNIYVEGDGEMQDRVKSAYSMSVIDGDFFGTGRTNHEGWRDSYVLIPHSWSSSATDG